MAGHVSDSHLAKLSFTVSRPQIPFEWRYMEQDVYGLRSVLLHHIHRVPWRPCPIYALMTERGQLQSGDGSAGPRRVWEAPFQVEGRPHHQNMNADEKCPPAIQCSTCGPPIFLHWCPVRLHFCAVPEQQAQRDILF